MVWTADFFLDLWAQGASITPGPPHKAYPPMVVPPLELFGAIAGVRNYESYEARIWVKQGLGHRFSSLQETNNLLPE